MKKSISVFLTSLLSLILAASAFAQNSTHAVTVTLLDASNDEPVSYATVSVTAKGATQPTKYTLTGEKGNASLDGLRDGTYTFVAEMMGYVKYEKEVVVKGANVALGEVKLELDREMLEAASVTGVGAPVTIKKDTIEYNAGAFKTTENDVLEDLLKKLPGVEVNDDGSIVVNGQTVTKVYMDGKTFFMDDPQVATKNIPAKLVDKVKVVQKKSDQAEFTGIDDGQEETVLDLSVQGGMMNGLVGNVSAGIGHDIPAKSTSGTTLSQNYNDTRYQSNLFLGNFTNNRQIALLGNANNANAMGFGAGNMGGGRAGFGGGGRRGGITESYMIGTNISGNLFDDKMSASGNYMFNSMDNESLTNSYTVNKFDGYNQIQNSESASMANSIGHTLGMRIEHQFSKSSSIIFQPQFGYNNGSTLSTQQFTTDTDYLNGTVNHTNDGWSSNAADTRNFTASGNFMYRQRILIPGRTLTVNVRYNFTNGETNGFTQSLTNTFGARESSDLVNQRNAQKNNNASINANATYTEPLGNFFYVEANYSYGWNHSNSSKDVFNSGSIDPASYDFDHHDYNPSGEIFDPSYSNSIVNDYINQSAGVNLLFQNDRLHAQVGGSLRPQRTHNVTTRSTYQVDTTISVLNWSPTAMLTWEAGDYFNIRFFYRGNSNQPNISQLMPVPDNSNPLRVSLGNPSLAPYFSHNMNGDIRYNNRQKFSSANLRFNAGMVQNPIVNVIMTTPTGIQYTMPFNGSNSYNGNVNLMTNTPIFTSRLTLSTQTGVNGSRSFSFTSNTIDVSKYFRDDDMTDFNYPLFLKDFSDLDNSSYFIKRATTSMNASERLTLSYRADDFDFRVGGNTNYQRTWLNSDLTTATWRSAVNGAFTWNWELAGLTFDTDMNYNWYAGYDTNPDPTFIWNLQIEKLLFNRRATLSLRGYDLLGQTKNFSLSVTDNRYAESVSNSLGRYVIAAFTYRFGSFGGRNGRMGMGGGGGGNRGGRGGGGMPPGF